MLQKYELTDNFEENRNRSDCTSLCAIFVEYALDFKKIGVYNGDKYEMKTFFRKSKLKEDKINGKKNENHGW